MCRPEILRRLQDEAGGQLEAVITELACSQLRNNSGVQDHILEAGRRTLVLFAGDSPKTAPILGKCANLRQNRPFTASEERSGYIALRRR